MKHELLHMRKQGSGAIVNCSSLGGLVGPPGRSAYHATKHGVIGMTKSAVLDYATRNIRINAVNRPCANPRVVRLRLWGFEASGVALGQARRRRRADHGLR